MLPLIPELYCTSIAASKKFYTEILGFEILYERPEEKFVMFARQGVQMMFQEIGAAREWITAPLEQPFGRGISFQIKTTAVDDLYAVARRAGATVFLPMEEKWYRADDLELGNRQFIVQDPDGYLLRFYQDLGKRKLA